MGQDHVGGVLQNILRIFLALIILRIALALATSALRPDFYAAFFDTGDLFADSLKSGIAQISVSAPLLNDPRTLDWPPLVQHYLHHNDYLQPGMSVHHSPPFATLLLMAFAAMLLIFSPTAVISILVALYAAGSLGLSRMMAKLPKFPTEFSAFPVIFLAYPSLFMINRGNFHSGFTSLAVIFYVLSACCKRWKWASWLGLAIAVNLRPNVAIFALLELYRSKPRLEAMKGMAIAGLLSLLIGLISLWFAHRIDPAYSLDAFRNGFALYQTNYVEGKEGLLWNASLPNVAKVLRHQMLYSDIYSPALATAANLLGAGALLGVSALAWLRRIAGTALAFAVTAICGLFTPVLGEYHVLIFMAPLLLLILTHAEYLPAKVLWRGAAVIFALQMLCLLAWAVPATVIFAAVAAAALAFPFLVRRIINIDGHQHGIDAVLAIVCIAALSPLGDGLTNGMAAALMVLSTLVMLFWHAIAVEAVPETSDNQAPVFTSG